MRFLFLLLFFLSACSSPGPEHFREAGSAYIRALVKELKKVQTREQLVDHEAKIRAAFHHIQALAKEVESYLKAHPETEIPLFSKSDQELSDELQCELNRLLRKEGCQEILNQLLLE